MLQQAGIADRQGQLGGVAADGAVQSLGLLHHLGGALQGHIHRVGVFGALVGAAFGGLRLAEQQTEAVAGGHGVEVRTHILRAHVIGDPAVLQGQHRLHLDGVVPGVPRLDVQG